MSTRSRHVARLVLREADLKSRPYEFLNTADSEEMTVNISVPADTQMKASLHARSMFRFCKVVDFLCPWKARDPNPAASSASKDVSVKLSAKTIRVEIKGHEMQPCVIDGSFFQAVDPAGCDHHLEGSGAKRAGL